jgi:phosphoglycerate kinase
MRNIKQIKNLKGKRVLLRVDFNVPIKNGKVEDDFRIKKSLPTIKFLLKKGAKIVLISHLGKGGETLLPVAKALNKYIKAKFVPAMIGYAVSLAIWQMKDGDVILLENLRNEKWEQDGDIGYAKTFKEWGDIYVNEAFSVSHRKDTSIILVPKLLPAYAGFQFEQEVKNLSHAFKNPKHPFLFILGGAKFSTKMPLIKKYLKTADFVFVGGALTSGFLKAKGYEIGKSLADETTDYDIGKILKNKKLVLPSDVLVDRGDELINKKADEVKEDETILDIGQESVKSLTQLIKSSKMILMNGPLGKYEERGEKATEEVLKAIANAKAETVIGGGDTVALVSKMKLEKKFSFVSTGGGATLEFLSKGTLPGIEALK